MKSKNYLSQSGLNQSESLGLTVDFRFYSERNDQLRIGVAKV